MAENPSKSGKHLKLKSIPSFLEHVGVIKVISEFSFRHPKCHFWARKEGHFCQTVHFWVQKNGTLSAQTKILRPLLLVQHPPKWMELTLVLSVYYSQEKKERKEEKSHFGLCPKILSLWWCSWGVWETTSYPPI